MKNILHPQPNRFKKFFFGRPSGTWQNMELSLGNGPVQQKPNLVEVDRQVPMDIQGWVKPIQPNASNLVSSLQ